MMVSLAGLTQAAPRASVGSSLSGMVASIVISTMMSRVGVSHRTLALQRLRHTSPHCAPTRVQSLPTPHGIYRPIILIIAA